MANLSRFVTTDSECKSVRDFQQLSMRTSSDSAFLLLRYVRVSARVKDGWSLRETTYCAARMFSLPISQRWGLKSNTSQHEPQSSSKLEAYLGGLGCRCSILCCST